MHRESVLKHKSPRDSWTNVSNKCSMTNLLRVWRFLLHGRQSKRAPFIGTRTNSEGYWQYSLIGVRWEENRGGMDKGEQEGKKLVHLSRVISAISQAGALNIWCSRVCINCVFSRCWGSSLRIIPSSSPLIFGYVRENTANYCIVLRCLLLDKSELIKKFWISFHEYRTLA